MPSFCEFESFISSKLLEENIPGAGVITILNGEVSLCRGFGVMDQRTQIPINDEILFPWASISKAFAGIAVARLVDQGLLTWKTKVIDILPDFCMFDPWVTREFEIQDLLCHRSGLPAQPVQNLAIWGYSRDDIKAAHAKIPPIHSFRTTYAYNNVLYVWLEDVVQKLTGKPWKQFLKEEVLNPLGMDQTRVGRFHFTSPDLITGHILDEENYETVCPVEFSLYPDVFLAAGGLVGPLKDLARWMQFQLSGTPGLVSKENFAYTRFPQTPIDAKIMYGMGWRLDFSRQYMILAHGGLIKGIRHQLWLIPDLNCGIAVLSNLTQNNAVFNICEHFTQLCMGEGGSDSLINTSGIFKKPEVLPQACIQTQNPSRYIGVYENDMLQKGTICDENGELFLLLGPKPARVAMTPIGDDHFSLFFTGDSGAHIGEGHWGTLLFQGDHIILKGYPRFDGETFIMIRI